MPIDITRVGRNRLTRPDGSIVSEHNDIKEAYARASAQPPGTYLIATPDERVIVTADATAPPPPPPPVPVDCAGTWGPWARVAGSDGPCVNGARTYQEARTFTVTTAPANGGAACPVSPETRTQTEACTVTPPPPPPVGTPSTADLLARLLNFAQVWKRNWSHGGHNVVLGAGSPAFGPNYGYWERSTQAGQGYEPHLFDRPTAGHRLFEMTGDAQWRAQFEDDFAWYASQIGADGVFVPKGGGDTKYGYITPFVLAQQAGILTLAQRAAADRIYAGWLADWPDTANLASAALWTEREMAFSLEAAVGYYRLTGLASALTRGQALLDQWDAVVAQTGNLGAPRVSYTKHEGGGPGGTSPSDPTSSPWMAALYFQAARQFVAVQPSAAGQVHRQVSAYLDYLDGPYNGQARGFYDGALAHPENSGFVFPMYLTETQIGDAGYDAAHQGHALDVAGLVAYAVTAKEALGQDTTRAVLRLNQMKATAARTFSTEAGAYERTATWLPRYRVNPPRMGNWWIRGLYELVSLGR